MAGWWEAAAATAGWTADSSGWPQRGTPPPPPALCAVAQTTAPLHACAAKPRHATAGDCEEEAHLFGRHPAWPHGFRDVLEHLHSPFPRWKGRPRHTRKQAAEARPLAAAPPAWTAIPPPPCCPRAAAQVQPPGRAGPHQVCHLSIGRGYAERGGDPLPGLAVAASTRLAAVGSAQPPAGTGGKPGPGWGLRLMTEHQQHVPQAAAGGS